MSDTEQHWCDYCQDVFPVNHEDANYSHKAGPQYGPSGLELWKLREVRAYAAGPLNGTPHGERLLAILDTPLADDDEPDDECEGAP